MRMLAKMIAAVAATAVAGVAASQTPSSLIPLAPRIASSAAPLSIDLAPAGQTVLTKPDVEAWLDGYMPFALARANIAGGVVVVVKDGQVLVQKGYGFSDVAKRTAVTPDATLFRPGSVSKLFTWTAVMQLVEQKKLNLDQDVNTYLDFKIPAYNGKPITLRHIMTHTAGFEESARYTITTEPMALGPLLKASLPARIFPPGVTPAYSNYATAVAGYIVERESGMPFDDYMESQVLRPIGMARSTFRQPLPPALRPLMSKGYALASQEAKGFEFVGPAPAGSLSATGSDMARFMIAHLNNGAGLLRPETAAMMHDTKLTIVPPLNRMALGFYEMNLGGRRTIGHGGDTQYFHSELALFLDDNVGIFVSTNSAGQDGATRYIRGALLHDFARRYFAPESVTGRVDAKTAKAHATMLAGTYVNSRGFKTNFLRILNLISPVTLGVDADGGILVPFAAGTAGQPRKWIEIAPFVWRDDLSGERLAAKVVDGQVVRWSWDEVSPFMMFDRVPWYLNGAWLLPAFGAALTIILLGAIGWPAGALARRRYGATLAFKGRRLAVHRTTKLLAWLAIALIAGWIALIMFGLEDLEFLSGGFTMPLILLQLLSPIVFVGLVGFTIWTLRYAWREGRWTAKLWAALMVLAAAILLWVALGFNLIGFGTNF